MALPALGCGSLVVAVEEVWPVWVLIATLAMGVEDFLQSVVNDESKCQLC